MLDPEDSVLLIHLLAAAEGPHPEAAVLSLLAGRLQADGGRIYQHGQCWALGTSDPMPVSLPDLMSGLRLNRVYTSDELPTPTVSDLRAVGMAMTGAGATWVVLTRTRGQFRAIDTARLAAYAPHAQQVLGLASRLSTRAAQQSVQAIAARRMGVGVALRDRSGAAPQLDAVARDLLTAHKLAPADLARVWPQDSVADGKIVALALALDMLVLPAPKGHGQMGLLRAHDTALPQASLIAKALGITKAEARLARALAAGTSLSDAATDLGLTAQTARFYSKQIFAKTGLSGQPALMRRIWTSALALAR